MKRKSVIGLVLGATCVLLALAYESLFVFTPARDDRDWTIDQSLHPDISIQGDIVSIKNVRNFAYRTKEDYTPQYYDAVFDVRKISRAWYVVEPFGTTPGIAHSFLSFEFEGPRFVAISVEIRKEKGEKFSPLKGLFPNYELMYVIADEQDVIKLRSNIREDDVYVYPVNAEPEKVREIFLSMLERAQKLQREPEFYHSVTNNCTSNIAAHINQITPGRVRWSYHQVLPAYSDRRAYDLGLLDQSMTFEELRERWHINERAERYKDDPRFSERIRER